MVKYPNSKSTQFITTLQTYWKCFGGLSFVFHELLLNATLNFFLQLSWNLFLYLDDMVHLLYLKGTEYNGWQGKKNSLVFCVFTAPIPEDYSVVFPDSVNSSVRNIDHAKHQSVAPFYCLVWFSSDKSGLCLNSSAHRLEQCSNFIFEILLQPC